MRISVSYLLYAMNKLRLSAYTHTPSGIPKLKLWLSLSILYYFSQVLPLLTLVRSQTQSKHCVWLHSALRLRNALHFYPHRGIKSHVHAAAFYDFKPFPLSINTVGATLCGRPFMFRNIKREKNIAFGYPKAEALAQFVHSALFFSSPAAAHACSLSINTVKSW